ncbi:MAG TPA: YihY/virulence factor BrkB family protein [Pseudolabrys sp.]|nr:YihY/virulence factor BrkB family protein [Pseudolabrys sp.]
MRRYLAMKGLRPAIAAAIRRNLPSLVAGIALVGTFALARALEQRPPPPEVKPAVPSGGWPFWRRVLYRTYREINDDRLLALGAGVVFYGLLALFPAITALVSSYALFADPVTIGTHLAAIASVMPAGAFRIVEEQVGRIVAHGNGGLSAAFLVSLALAVWSANAGMKAIIDALNIVYGVKERRGFFRLNLASLAFTVGAIAAMLLALAAVVALPILTAALHIAPTNALLPWLRWPALLVLVLLALALLYRFGPDLDHPHWHWISPGAAFAAVAWLAGSSLLSWYLGHLADYDATYGSLGAGIGLMMWLWLSAIVVLVGAEFNSEIDADGLLKPPEETIGPPR